MSYYCYITDFFQKIRVHLQINELYKAMDEPAYLLVDRLYYSFPQYDTGEEGSIFRMGIILEAASTQQAQILFDIDLDLAHRFAES